MNDNHSFSDYPKILKIEDDGKIIALDKNGKVNTDLNIHTVSDEQQQAIFGDILYQPYRRTTKSNQLYDTNSQKSHNQEPHYNQQDRERELYLLDENKKAKRKNVWLGLGVIVLLIVVIIFAVTTYINSDNNEQQSTKQTSEQQSANQNQSNDTQGSNVNFQRQNNEVKKDIQSLKENISNSNNNTDSKLQALQDKVDSLKQEADSNKTNNLAEKYQTTVDDLKQAKNEKDNGNTNQMQAELDKANHKLDDIKSKFSSLFNDKEDTDRTNNNES
ncbi:MULTISPECIES: hypothetical protein [Staphylococcus]|uniref:hypothetical protein n=1 Tax=Staphylococcus TaxID=1279 RepID=UPI000BC30AAF|nr:MULTISPECIES: hypothetical protein [Staphylococcus]ATH59128.1 hypothetical protein BJD96_01615 [Staphylococcus nepalensis]ATH64220.1 hypothetical protein BJG89_01960 [Staphylococcus nepalensis]AWI43581.1 hypothetical protein BJG88_01685 [Staphylococcus nepalensis]NWN85415.1 hypothetical protein [Staphylococcus sp.]